MVWCLVKHRDNFTFTMAITVRFTEKITIGGKIERREDEDW